MDGASKFVRGDAIAGILVLAVNIVAGIIIGVAQKGMSFGHAAQTYTVLSIGDGLVAQIPALLVSTGSALLATRGDDAQLGQALSGQMFARKRPLIITGALLGMIGLLPGMPHLLFLGLGGVAAWASSRAKDLAATPDAADPTRPLANAAEPGRTPDEKSQRGEIEAALPVEMLSLEVGLDLLNMVDADPRRRAPQAHRHAAQAARRRARHHRAGRPHPRRPPHAPGRVSRAALAASRSPSPRCSSIASSRSTRAAPRRAHLPGEATVEPTFGLPAKWLQPSERARAEAAGCTVVDSRRRDRDPPHRSSSAATRTSCSAAARPRTCSTSPASRTRKVVEELIPTLLPMGTVIQVLRKLLAEGVSIRDLRTILEALADHAPATKNADDLVEMVRQRLARRLTRGQLAADGALRPLVLDPRVEQMLREGGVKHTRSLTKLTEDLANRAKDLAMRDEPPLLVVAPDLRRTVAGIAAAPRARAHRS